MRALFLFNLHLNAKAASLGLTLGLLSIPGFQSLPLSLQKIQEMLHPRNWCLCRWNSSIVTISVKWQQCSPDHCLRDDILLNSISFLIIFSCSIHHLSLCSPPLLSAQNIFLTSHQSFPPLFSSHMWFHSTWLPLPLWNVLSLRALVKKGPSDMFRSVNAWCHHPYYIRRAFHISCMNVLLKHSHGWLVWFETLFFFVLLCDLFLNPAMRENGST